MELTGNYRHELKYQIGPADHLALRQRLKAVMQQDLHTGADGRYTIRRSTVCSAGKNSASATITTIFPLSRWKRSSSTTIYA